MLAISVDQFRLDLPEFLDSTSFPDSVIRMWLAFACNNTNEERFGSSSVIVAELHAAHHISLESQNMLTAAVPGGNNGITQREEVDTVRIQYDTETGAIKNGGHWNLTTYGTRYKYMVSIFCAGPIQLGFGGVGGDVSLAWTGPDTRPSPTGFGN